MPLATVNATEDGLQDAAGRAPDWAALAAGEGPIIIMVHGFRFAPGAGRHCPHAHILSLAPLPGCTKALSWPRGLGFGGEHPDEGLAIGFGWQARGRLGRVWRRAEETGADLAAMVDALARHAPQRPVHAICHSMGARVVLAALHRLEVGRLSRIILLTPAEYHATAERALCAPAARGTEAITVTTAENLVFDLAQLALLKPGQRRDLPMAWRPSSLGATLRLDDPALLDHLGALGFPLPRPEGRVSHWSVYLRPGAMALYAALLRRPGALPLSRLRPGPAEPQAARMGPSRPLSPA